MSYYFPKNEDSESLIDIQLLPLGGTPNALKPADDKIQGVLRIVTSRGFMRLEKTELWEGLVYEQIHSEFIHGLGSWKPYFNLFEKISGTMFAQVVKFLKEMYDAHTSESEAMLLYKPATDEQPSTWAFYVPDQIVTHGSVNYTNNLEELKVFYDQGFMDIGTIHSHADFSAFHSGVDIHDEEQASSGIHITVGNLNNKNSHFSLVMSGVINGSRLQFKYLDRFIEGITLVDKQNDVCPIFTFTDPTEFNNFTVSEKDRAKVKERESFRQPSYSLMEGNRPFGFQTSYNNSHNSRLSNNLQRTAEIYNEDKELVPLYDVDGKEIPKDVRKKIANQYTIAERSFFGLISNDEINLVLEKKLPLVEILSLVLDYELGSKIAQAEPENKETEKEDPNVTAAC